MLHIVNKSPFANNSLESCLDVASHGSTILFIEDGVYAALGGGLYSATIEEARTRFEICVLRPDLEARGVAGKLIDGIRQVDYGEFVDLVAENERVQSWL